MDGLPRTRAEGLLVERIDDEVLVYDTETDAAHCLLPLAAAIFELADGTRPEPELAELAGQRLGRRVGEDEVTDALAQLQQSELLAPVRGGISRREMVRKVAVAGAAGAAGLTLVKTIAAPTAQAANSGLLPNGSPCDTDAQCQGGCCVSAPGGTCSTPGMGGFCPHRMPVDRPQ